MADDPTAADDKKKVRNALINTETFHDKPFATKHKSQQHSF